MSLTWKLFAAHARQQKARFALTALAMVAAVGVVLWVVSAYEAIAAKFDDQTADFIGNYTLFVVPTNPLSGLPPQVVAGAADDPAVQVANPVAQFRMRFRKAGDASGAANKAATPAGAFGPLGPSVVGTASAEPRYELIDGRWLSPGTDSEAVVSRVVAETLSLKLGDAIEFRTKDGPLALTVVGITEQVEGVEWAMTRTKGGAPGGVNRGPASTTAYVPLSVVEKLTEAPPKINLVEIRLRTGRTAEQFRDGPVASRLTAEGTGAELLLAEDIKRKLEGGFDAQGARKQAYFVTALSILASAFIIFTTLSMGVNERARQLAMLRAVGLQRAQVAKLVLAEALVLAVFGWVGGLVGGYLLLKAFASASPGLFPNGVAPGTATLVTTGACSLAGALLAAVFPIWKATRISPIEAMAPLPAPQRTSRWYAAVGIAALVLIAVNPVLVYLPEVPEKVRFALIMLVGAPASVAGFVLAAPLAILLVERLLVPPLAWVFRLRASLVQTQLSSHLWRTAGLAASLMLGLGLYTATQVWGWSMLSGFLPGTWTPNTIVKFDPGLTDEQVEQVRRTPGVRADAVLPVAAEQVKLAGDPLRSRERDSAVRQDNVILVGVDADAAFGGNDPLFQMAFVQGDRAEALAKLKQGRYCLVPDTFPKFAGLGVGDKVGLVPPQAQDRPVEYTIAGVVEMPGSNWITKLSGARRHSVRTAGLVFAPRAQVRDDFDLKRVEFVWLNAEPGTTKGDLEERFRPLASSGPPPGGKGGGKAGGKGERGEGPELSPVGARRGAGPEPLRVTLLDDVRGGLRTRGGSAVLAMGLLPLITLLVVSLGVVNTVAASVRARRWEFGVLRAIGLRRFGLVKLVFAEALLVGLVASVLSFAFGLVTGWTCLGLVRYVSNPWFEGVATPLTVPWSVVAVGYGMTFVLCFLAALWPALSAGRSEPLKLLQGGRAVM